MKIGGEGGIRTHVTVARKPHFECGAFDLSATSPRGRVERLKCTRSIGSAAVSLSASPCQALVVAHNSTNAGDLPIGNLVPRFG